MNETATPQQAPSQQPMFNIEKLYVKDLSLEIPHAPGIFLEREQPQIELQLHTQAASVDEGVFEVTVTVTVTAKLAEKNQVMFLVEAKQAGIFQLRNLPPEEQETVLGVVCPNILYPYLREVVSDVAVRAGFAPVLLNPINFEALYQQQKQQQVEGAPVTTH
jgi:preprotein translocase subunit SecB